MWKTKQMLHLLWFVFVWLHPSMSKSEKILSDKSIHNMNTMHLLFFQLLLTFSSWQDINCPTWVLELSFVDGRFYKTKESLGGTIKNITPSFS
jgi:hypothetical protein